jgi:hypothetical protein
MKEDDNKDPDSVVLDEQNIDSKTKEELLREKLEELRKRDPFIYQ